MSEDKSESVSLERDRYESLHMDNRAYINMPEQEDYLNPVSSEKENDSPPPPPEKDPPSKRSLKGASNQRAPLPPKRDQSSCSDKFSASNSSLGSNVSIRYPKMGNGELTLEKKMEKEKVLLRQKNSAFDSGALQRNPAVKNATRKDLELELEQWLSGARDRDGWRKKGKQEERNSSPPPPNTK